MPCLCALIAMTFSLLRFSLIWSEENHFAVTSSVCFCSSGLSCFFTFYFTLACLFDKSKMLWSLSDISLIDVLILSWNVVSMGGLSPDIVISVLSTDKQYMKYFSRWRAPTKAICLPEAPVSQGGNVANSTINSTGKSLQFLFGLYISSQSWNWGPNIFCRKLLKLVSLALNTALL